MTVPVVLLAGGLGRRIGGDKALQQVAGLALVAHVRDRMAPQASALLLNANGDPARFSEFGLPVAADVVEGFVGPLAGILTGMRWVAARHPDARHLVTVSIDTPFLPIDLVARLVAARMEAGADIAVASSGGRAHPIVALWPVAFADALESALVEEGVRRVDYWTARHVVANAAFPFFADTGILGTGRPIDPFFNVNTADDLAEAERVIGTMESRPQEKETFRVEG